ncbi:MAG: transporter [Rhodospirillales bacterium]|nr:transporter [Rhodospirillales bacterium]
MVRPSYLLHQLITRSFLRPLRHRDFALTELVGWFSIAGVWFQRVGLGWLTWDLTHSGAWLGIIGMAEAAPSILFAPLAGAYADRFDRLVMGRIIQVSIMTMTAVLAVITILGLVDIYILFFATLAIGLISSFWAPVRHSIVANVVPREDLPQAVALHSMLFNVARFVGPAMAGPIIAYWGVGWAFAATSVGYLGYLIVLFTIRLTNPDEKSSRDNSIVRDMRDGFAYAANHPALKYLFLAVIVTAVFFRAYGELLAGIAETVFSQGAEGFGYLVSVTGGGAILGALWIGMMSRPIQVLRGFFIALWIGVIFLTLFAATSTFWLALVYSVVLGFSTTAINISTQVLIQSTVKGVMRGRVMSFYSMVSRAGPAVGAVLVGWASVYIGFEWPIIGTVVVTAIVGAYVFFRRREIAAGLDRDVPKDAIAVPSAEASPADATAMEKRRVE